MRSTGPRRFVPQLSDRRRQLDDSHNIGSLEGKSLLYPAIRFQGHSIWGLTFRVLTLFSDVLDAAASPGRDSRAGAVGMVKSAS